MYRAAGQFGGAGARYRNIENASRVDGASPHKLIAILFEELLRAVEATRVAMERGDIARQADRQARALSILQALDASLDMERGGEVAANLSRIYREGRRLIAAGAREKRTDMITRARDMLAEIASAWDNIGG
ncbi:MAG: flagellar export chaperone FliS [Sphingomonadaceae bacterium]